MAEKDQERDYTKCDNCRKLIHNTKFDLHESFCSRRNKYCGVCDEAYDKNEESDHQLLHVKTVCTVCSKQFENKHLESHVKICKKPMLCCQFCENELEEDLFKKHVQQCGARTQPCTLCNNNVKKNEMAVHLTICSPVKAVKRRIEQHKETEPMNSMDKYFAKRQQFSNTNINSKDRNRQKKGQNIRRIQKNSMMDEESYLTYTNSESSYMPVYDDIDYQYQQQLRKLLEISKKQYEKENNKL